MAERQVKVGILITARDLASRVLRGVHSGFTNLRNSLFSLKTVFTALIAGAFARGLKSLFDIGAAAEETANKFNTVFGAARGRVQEFLDTFGVIAGLSREQGQALSATTGQIVQGLGFAQQASADFSTQVIKLAADMASFNNATTPEVLEAINSALTGITVPLKQYGVVLRESDISQRALANSGKATEAQLTKQEKATAALQLITEAAGVAIGDMERTQDSMANTAKRISSQLETLHGLFGEIFVSAIRMSGGIGDVSTKIQDFTKWVEENKEAISAWGSFVIKTVGFVISVFKNLIRVAFNIGQTIGDMVTFIGEAIRAAFDPDETIEDAWKDFKNKFVQNFKDVVAATNDTAQALADMAVAGEHAAEVSRGEHRAGTVAGGPPVVPPPAAGGGDAENRVREVARLGQEAETLVGRFKAGLISADQFRAGLDTLVPAMMKLRDSGKLNDEQLLKMISGIEMLREQAIELAQSGATPIQVIDPGQVDVVERLSKGLSISLVRSMGLGVNMIEEMDASMQNLVNSTLMGFGNAFSSVLDAIATQGKISGAELAKGILLGIAKAASAEAGFYFARGIAALAGTIFPIPNPANAVSAGQYFHAAALMAAVSATAGLAASAVGGRGGRGGAGAGGAIGAEQQSERLSGIQDREATIIIEGGLLDMSDPRQADALADAIAQLSGRRVRIRAASSVTSEG